MKDVGTQMVDKAGFCGLPVNSPECYENNLITLGMQLSGSVIAWYVHLQSISLQATACATLVEHHAPTIVDNLALIQFLNMSSFWATLL